MSNVVSCVSCHYCVCDCDEDVYFCERYNFVIGDISMESSCDSYQRDLGSYRDPYLDVD